MTRDDQGTAITRAALAAGDYTRCPRCEGYEMSYHTFKGNCSVKPECECPPGYRHRPDCVEVTG